MTQRSSSNEQFSTSSSESGFSTDPGATQPFNTPTSGSMSSQGSTGQSAVGQVKQTASNVTDQAKEQAGQLADQARTQVTSRISDQKGRAAEGLGSMAEALRQTGQQLRDQDQSGITQYVDQAADQVERLSTYLRENEIGDLVNDVERFARRQPTLFIGGAFTLGLLAARFLKSSSPQGRGSYTQRGYTGSRYYEGGNYGTSGYDRGYAGSAGYSGTTGMGSSYGANTPSGTGYGASSTSNTDYGSSSTARTGLAGTNTSDTGSNVNSSQSGSLGSSDTSSTINSRYGTAENSRQRGGTEGL